MTEKPKPRARRKLPTLLREETEKLIAKHKADSTEYETNRARRKKAALPFYTPIDGWKPDTRGMLTRMDSMLRIMNQHRRDNPFEYWAAVRELMI